MAQVDEGGTGDEDDLQDPEADVRDGEGLVIAHVLATGLLCVAHHVGLLIAPHLSKSNDHDPEKEQDAHPDLPNDSGVEAPMNLNVNLGKTKHDLYLSLNPIK
uniref:Uncharacterized protein n=1 Tax=Periophthalmus magnuspinnatus TaxID=409849 RepID=A0A3B4AW68_9GOBI